MSEMKIKDYCISFLDHIFIFRIPLLAPVWTVFLYGAALGKRTALYKPYQEVLPVFVAFSFLVGGIYILNQIYDIESDRINDKLFILPQKLVRLPVAWTLAVLSLGIPVIYAFMHSRVLGIIFLLSAVVGLLYNCSPFELKNHPIGGLAANMTGHGLLAFAAGWFSIAEYDHRFLIPALAVSLANGAVFLCTTIVDTEGDKDAGKQTFSVRFGEKNTARTAAVLVAGTLAASLYVAELRLILLITAAASLPFYLAISFRYNRSLVFQAFKIPVFVFTCGVMFTAWWYALLIAFTFIAARLYYSKRFGKCYPTFKSQ